MEKITEYLETNIKLAYKTVTFHFKNYIWFYIALFIIQTLLGIINISSQIHSHNMRETVTDMYNSHYVYYSLNIDQEVYFNQIAHYYFADEYFFDIKETKEYSDKDDKNYHCDIYIRFTEDPQKSLERFNEKYLDGLEARGQVYSSPTPLFSLENDIQKSEQTYGFYSIVIALISLILLISLYNIRANHFRFDYGIYMAFGADKKKLFHNSFWEMSVIAILTFLPALLVSGAVNFITAKMSETAFNFNIFDFLKVLLLTLSVNVISVLSVVVRISIKTPLSLITSKDNSNLVISPRKSKNLFIKRPLSRVISLSFFRYVRYYAVLILSGVIFSVLFVCLSFYSVLYSQKIQNDQPQFRVEYSNGKHHTENDQKDFLSIKGIIASEKEEYTSVMGLDEHILINKENTKSSANRVVFDDQHVAMDNVDYHAADDEIISRLENKKHTGDLYSVLTNENMVIISDSFNNTTHFNFKPGDKIKLADYYTKIKDPDYMLYGDALLKERLDCYIFKYDEVTVGAVIHDDLSDENLKIYMNEALYTKKTGKTPIYDSVYLYADDKLTHKQLEKLHSDILEFCETKYRGEKNSQNVIVYNTYADVYERLEHSDLTEIKLSIISFLILAVSSIIWFFSQSIFYSKRSNEYTLLQEIGFNPAKIRRIFITEAFYIASLSAITYISVSFAAAYGLFKLMNSWVFMYKIRYVPDFPLNMLMIGLGATIIFSVLSTVMPYIRYKKKQRNLVPEN